MGRTGSIAFSFITVYGDVIEDYSLELFSGVSTASLEYSSSAIEIVGYETIITPAPALIDFKTPDILISGAEAIITIAPALIDFSNIVLTVGEIQIVSLVSPASINYSTTVSISGYESIISPEPASFSFLSSNIEPIGYKTIITLTPATIEYSSLFGAELAPITLKDITVLMTTIGVINFSGDTDITAVGDSVITPTIGQVVFGSGNTSFLLANMVEITPAIINFINNTVTIGVFDELILEDKFSLYDSSLLIDAPVLSETVSMTETINSQVLVVIEDFFRTSSLLSPGFSFTLELLEMSSFSDLIERVKKRLSVVEDSFSVNDSLETSMGVLIADFFRFKEESSASASYKVSTNEDVLSNDTAILAWLLSLSDLIITIDTMSPQFYIALSEYGLIHEALSISAGSNLELAEILMTIDLNLSSWLFNIAEQITISSEISGKECLAILEYCKFTGALFSSKGYFKELLEAMDVVESAFAAWHLKLSELLSSGDSAKIARQLCETIFEELSTLEKISCLGIYKCSLDDEGQVIDEATGLLSLIISDLLVLDGLSTGTAVSSLVLLDSFTASSIAQSKGSFNVFVNEALSFGVHILLDGEMYECFVLNTSAFHPSVYSNFKFNSYCNYQGRLFASGAEGIFEIVTDSDENIGTGILFHKTDFKIVARKKMRKAYLGITGNDPVIMMESDDGEKRAYTINDKGRVSASRAVKGNIWELSIADFNTFDSLKLIPIIMSRGV